MSLLIGADISAKMLAYARSQAEQQQINNQIEFVVMDALRMLEFPDEFFDLVNHRFAVSWLRTWDWGKLLDEYLRVCKPGGMIRVTENKFGVDSTSPALTRLFELGFQVAYQAGYYFTEDRSAAISHLARILSLHGVQDVQTHDRTSSLESFSLYPSRSSSDAINHQSPHPTRTRHRLRRHRGFACSRFRQPRK